MKRYFIFFLVSSLSMSLHAQKKSKGKSKTEITNFDSLTTAPVNTKSSKKDSKKDKKNTKLTSVNYTPEKIIPVIDTSKLFTGIIKYLITSDDPSDKDSIFIVFGQNKIRVTMFIPGYRADQIFEKNMIANLNDSTFLELDTKKMTYKSEKLGARNAGITFSLTSDKKTGKVMSYICDEQKGEMTTNEGDTFETACLISKQHYFNQTVDYNFMNIQPLVMGYRIVLGFRTKSAENENTYIVAYKIDPGNTEAFFNLTGYKAM